MARKATTAKKPTNNKAAPRKPAAHKRAAAKTNKKLPPTSVTTVAPSIKINGVGFSGEVTPIGEIADDLIFDMTGGSLVATGACLGCPATTNVTGQLIGLDTNFTMAGTVAYNLPMRTRWTLTITDTPPNPPGPGTYSVALQVAFTTGTGLTPTDTAEFMVNV